MGTLVVGKRYENSDPQIKSIPTNDTKGQTYRIKKLKGKLQLEFFQYDTPRERAKKYTSETFAYFT